MSEVAPYKDFQDPITEMRRLTEQGIAFRLEFRKKNGERRIIDRALLRPQSIGKYDRNSAYKLQFIDQVNDTLGSCFIPLILSLNERKIILNGKDT